MNDSSYHTEYTYITHVFTLSMFMQLQMWMAHNWLRLLSVLLVHNLLLNYSCTKSETCGLNMPTELNTVVLVCEVKPPWVNFKQLGH